MNSDKYIVSALIITNMFAGFGCAVPIANSLAKVTGRMEKLFRYFVMFIGIYFVECIAFAAGMCTQVLTVAIGLVWAGLFSLSLRDSAPPKKILKTTFLVSLYGCIPTCSFAVLLPIFWVINGNSLLNVEQADKFGIPQFVPWPFNTLLGFCAGLAIGTILLKTATTTGTAHILIRNHLEKKVQNDHNK